jgi:hypothetical protein
MACSGAFQAMQKCKAESTSTSFSIHRNSHSGMPSNRRASNEDKRVI